MTRRTHKKPPAAAQSLLFSLKIKLNLYNSPSLNRNDSSLSALCAPSPDLSSSALSLTYLNSSHVSPKKTHFPGSDALDRFEPPAPRERSVSEIKLVPFREESPKSHQPVTISTFSFPPSLRFPSAIPRQLHTSLSSLDPDLLQISDATSSELDLKLYAFLSLGVIPDITRADHICLAALRRYCDCHCLGFTSQVPSKMLYCVETFQIPSFIHSSSTPWLRSVCISVMSSTHPE